MRETPTNIVPNVLRQKGWRWTPHGLQVAEMGCRILIPLPQIIIIFNLLHIRFEFL